MNSQTKPLNSNFRREDERKRGRRYEAGKQQISRILSAARTVLIDGGYAQLTLRRVAREARMSLALLQHYFRAKDDLLRALIEHTNRQYTEQCARVYAEARGNAKAKFLACIDYLIEDNRDSSSNTLYFELWALACHDPHANVMLDELFTYYRNYIAGLIRNMSPRLSKHHVDQRAVQIVALLEGLTLFIDRSKPRHVAMRGLTRDARANMLLLATKN
jgi:AcrR family transcriptional regulator